MTNDTSRGARFLGPGEIAEGKFDLDVFGNGRYQTAAASLHRSQILRDL